MLIVPSILTFKTIPSNSEGNTAIRAVLAEEPFETNSRFGCPKDAKVSVSDSVFDSLGRLNVELQKVSNGE